MNIRARKPSEFKKYPFFKQDPPLHTQFKTKGERIRMELEAEFRAFLSTALIGCE
jgi:hypothetical protein